MKESNKLLADFVGERIIWTNKDNKWRILRYDRLIFWEPDTDWNQLMQVVEKISLHETRTLQTYYKICDVINLNIGNPIQIIYNKVVETVKVINNELT